MASFQIKITSWGGRREKDHRGAYVKQKIVNKNVAKRLARSAATRSEAGGRKK